MSCGRLSVIASCLALFFWVKQRLCTLGIRDLGRWNSRLLIKGFMMAFLGLLYFSPFEGLQDGQNARCDLKMCSGPNLGKLDNRLRDH